MAPKKCNFCTKLPNNILTLECDHVLCIQCALDALQSRTSFVACPTGQHKTHIQSHVVEQLYQKQQQQQSFNVSKQTSFSQDSPQDYNKKFNVQRDTSFNNKYAEKKQMKSSKHKNIHSMQNYNKYQLFCKNHPQFQLIYCCISCKNCFICPECIIHGVHKGHEVQTIKKMISKIHSELSSKVFSLNCSIQGLVKASEDKKQIFQNKAININKLKEEAVQKYKCLRDELAREQKKILQKCHELLKTFEKQYKQIQSWIKNDLQQIQQQKNAITNILRPLSLADRSKSNQRVYELQIALEYVSYTQQKCNKNYLWIGKQSQDVGQFKNDYIDILSDRVQKICLPQRFDSKCNLNQQTKTSSLVASRQMKSEANIDKQKKQTLILSQVRYHPLDSLKKSCFKQNIAPKTDFFPTNCTQAKQINRKIKQNKFQGQTNFLIF